MTAPVLRVRRVRAHPDPLPLPRYETAQAAGLDLRADLEAPVTLAPGERALIPTGLALAIPGEHEGQIRPRSGRALREGLTCLNSPGTIDADFRGEVQVLLINLGQAPITLERGERIAQLVIAPVRRVAIEEVGTLPSSDRGGGGFGSTGR